MRKGFGFILVFCFCAVPVISSATTVTLELNGQVGDTEIDLGFPVGRLLTMSISGSIVIIPASGDCEVLSGGVACANTSYQVYPEVYVAVGSNSAWTSIQVLASGTFDQAYSVSDDDATLFFADGVGLLRVSEYIDPSIVTGCYGGPLCTYMGSNFVDADVQFNGPIFLTLEFEESVATVDETWGLIKVRYR